MAVHHLTYAYDSGRIALDDLSMEIATGSTVGLVGPNGAGKTTFFLCLAGVLRIQPGMVTICGLDPSQPQQRRQLPKKLGIVFQQSDDQIFNATVLEDVAFGPLNLGLRQAEVKDRVAKALTQVGLIGYEDRVPFHLSGGEKRRVALAGILAMEPEVLLLDEPSIFLDPRGRRELIGIIKDLPATKIVASHDLEMILETCDRVILLDQGRIMATGEPKAILAQHDLMEQHGLEVPYSLRG